jgi:hypothetical protein
VAVWARKRRCPRAVWAAAGRFGAGAASRYSGRVTSPPDSEQLGHQLVWLFCLAIPIATITWTITHEEIFREARDYCTDRSQKCRGLVQRKFFYVFTCEYCLSHYITIAFLLLTRYHLLLDDWRGYVLGLFGLVGVANIYMSAFGRLRLDLKSERLEVAVKEREAAKEPAAPTPTILGGDGKQTRADAVSSPSSRT